ncbi:hypothetical protein F5Y12DRAFT_718592 [Xylaria sp. FL1777]|nr:hypothetical protein F5Y12DRAFT_718592 [Xylaria sp. FL1777]
MASAGFPSVLALGAAEGEEERISLYDGEQDTSSRAAEAATAYRHRAEYGEDVWGDGAAPESSGACDPGNFSWTESGDRSDGDDHRQELVLYAADWECWRECDDRGSGAGITAGGYGRAILSQNDAVVAELTTTVYITPNVTDTYGYRS